MCTACKQDVAQRDGVAGFASQLLNRDLVSGGNPVLFAARAHYCEHGGYLSFKLLCRDLAIARRTRQAVRASPGKKRAVKRWVAASQRPVRGNLHPRWRAAARVIWRRR